jgi:hypothetical protein
MDNVLRQYRRSNSVAPVQPSPKGLGYNCKGHLRGMYQPPQGGLVKVAEGFSPTAQG